MKKILILILVAFSCTERGKQSSGESLTAVEFQEMISENSVLVDVRTPGEYSTGFIPGAVNIDFKSADFESRLDSLDKSKTYMLYCASGVRSTKAAEVMKGKGFTSVRTLEGGIGSWTDAGFSVQ